MQSEGKKYLVTLAVPVYGVERYIERCARSLFEQTYDNIEYIFVNDCTQDRSMKILYRVLQDYPSRLRQVRVVNHEHNKGLSGSRNTAVAAATGDFIMHIDSDDYVDTDIVERCVERQLTTGADIVSCNFIKHWAGYSEKWTHKRYDSVKEHCLAVVCRKDIVSIVGRLIRISLYRNNSIKSEEGTNIGEDYQVTPKLIYHADKTVVEDGSLYHYDYTNSKSYSHIFSMKNRQQSWRSFDIVSSYFKSKGYEYAEALISAEVRLITIALIISGKTPDGRCFYAEARKRLENIGRDYWTVEPFIRRAVLHLSFNFNLMRTYIQLSIYANRIIKKITSLSLVLRHPQRTT